MNKWLRLGGWAVLGLLLLWVVLEVVSIIFGIVSWLLSTVVSILVVGLLLYLAYLAVSKLFDGSGGRGGSRSRSREKEKIFE
jgi:Na+/H+ antiporter NhaD/arsenite permease-like protein